MRRLWACAWLVTGHLVLPSVHRFDKGVQVGGWATHLRLLQLGVFGFGGCEDGDVGVGVFP